MFRIFMFKEYIYSDLGYQSSYMFLKSDYLTVNMCYSWPHVFILMILAFH